MTTQPQAWAYSPDLDLPAVIALARRDRELREAIAALEDQRTQIRERFEALVPIGFTTQVDGKPVFRSQPPRSFSLEAAVAVASRFGIPVHHRTEVDAADLKERLKTAGLLDDAMLPGNGKPRVSL